MVAWNLVFGIARVTRNLWIKPALQVVDVVASAFEDKEEKKVEDVKPEE
jgi:general stress protein CsbA